MATKFGSGATALLQTLTAEADTIRQFVDLLIIEQTALRAGTTDGLPALAENKSRAGVKLNRLSTERNSLLSASGFGHDRTGIEAWCSKHPDEKGVKGAWASILSLAGDARELNRLNGELIKIHMQYNAQALEALRVGHSALELYGPDGQTQAAGNRRINDAA